MDHFLKYLAVNNSIVNWDTYGLMAHNYYLYNHGTRKLTWIPWDNNEALTKSPGITGTTGGGGPGGMTGLSLRMNEVGTAWPLINFVANDGVYFNRYKTHMRDFKNTYFKQANMDNLIEKYHTMITPFVVGAAGEQPKYTHLSSQNAFVAEKANLKTHISNRLALLNQFVP
jgi:spore coat protein CotH